MYVRNTMDECLRIIDDAMSELAAPQRTVLT
jgi:hypothetical protein